MCLAAVYAAASPLHGTGKTGETAAIPWWLTPGPGGCLSETESRLGARARAMARALAPATCQCHLISILT